MKIPPWFVVIWSALALTNGILAVALFRTRLANRWPSLLAIAADSALTYVVWSFTSYAQYYRFFWANAYLAYSFQVWLAFDVFRAVPAIRKLPKAALGRMLIVAAFIGSVAQFVSRGVPHYSHYMQVFIACSTKLVWAVVLLTCVLFLLEQGFGHTPTGLRIGSAMMFRVVTQTALFIYLAGFPPSRNLYLANAAENAVGIAVTAYLVYAILNARRADHLLVEDLKRTIGTL